MSAILTAIMALIAQLTPMTEASPSLVASTTREYYEPLYQIEIDNVPLWASIADDDSERTLGLSNTTVLPTDIAKVFAFPTDNKWSFWMKDMNYPIDIIWVDADGVIVHIEHNVDPSTYPKSFSPNESARYVIETVAGFAADNNVLVGDQVDLKDTSRFSS